MHSLSIASRLALSYNLPVLCVITSQLLVGLGIAAGRYLILTAQTSARDGDLVVVQADGRTIIGLYFPTDTDALLYLPDRPIIVGRHKVIARLTLLENM